MPLYLVIDNARWGFSHNVVRAADEAEARKLAGVDETGRGRVEVTRLEPEGDPAVLWCYDESPDTGDRD